MVWLAEIGFIILAIVAIVQFARAGRNATKLHEIAEERIAAYVTTLRRTGENPALSEMTDTELHDILGAAMRRLAAGRSRKFVLLVLGAVGVMITSIVLGIEDGWRAFSATMAVGGLALYGLERVLERATRAPLEDQGLDIERLRLD